MNRKIVMIAVSLLLLSTAAPAPAGDAATVKVALTDMSSAMGMGPAGRGMMGPGMMGQGMMGYGMMGPGMMGHGMMAIRINQPSVKAGTIHFDVTNWSQGMLHELLVVPVENPQATLPYDYSKAQVAEDQVKVLGDTGELPPSASQTLDLAFTPGSYLLICNVPGHYAAGMVAVLTVTS
jgi:uncharacterized cupredoxin-like copper-binding protein